MRDAKPNATNDPDKLKAAQKANHAKARTKDEAERDAADALAASTALNGQT